MPKPHTARQRRFAGAELDRLREGKETRSDMTEAELGRLASKPHNTPGDGTGLDAGRIPTKQGGRIG